MTVPFFAYFLCIIMISVISVLIIKIFEIENYIIIVLISLICVTSPSLIQIWSFDYTSITMTLSLVVAISADYYIIKYIEVRDTKLVRAKILKILFASALLSVSLGLYQIGLPTFFTILVMNLIINFLFKNWEMKRIIKTLLLYLVVSICGLIIYIYSNKLFSVLYYGQVFNSGYYGMGSNIIPEFGINDIINNFIRRLALVPIMPFIDYAGISTTLLSKIVLIVIYLFSFSVIYYNFKKLINHKRIIFLFLLFCLLISVNFQRIMVNRGISTRLTYSLIFIFIFILILVDKNILLNKKFIDYYKAYIKKIIITSYIIFIINLVFIAHASYYTAHMENIATKNYCDRIINKIINLDDFSDELPVVFIGTDLLDKHFWRNDYENSNNMANQYLYDISLKEEHRLSSFRTFSNWTYTTSDYVIIDDVNELPSDKNVFYKIHDYLNPTYSNDERIINMPNYPNDGSIKIIDGVIIVKLS